MKREERPGGEGRLVSQSVMQLVNSHGKVSVYYRQQRSRAPRDALSDQAELEIQTQ